MLRNPAVSASHLQKTLVFFLSMLFVVFLYTFLHEGGHALVGVLSGGRISVFNISFWDLGAHVEMEVTFSRTQMLLNNLAGVSLPILVWLVFILVVPKRANFALESVKVAASLMFLSPLIAWMVLPVLDWIGQSPSDDAINFLNNSGVHPLVEAGAALLVFCLAWALFSTRIVSLRQELDLFRQPDASLITPEVRKTLLGFLVVFLLCGGIAFGLNGWRFPAFTGRQFQPPHDYLPVNQLQLSAEGTEQRSEVYAFQLDQPAVVGIFLMVQDMRAELFELKLVGPDSSEITIIHAEGYSAHLDTPHLERQLQAGLYRCILTTRSTTGKVSIYSKFQP